MTPQKKWPSKSSNENSQVLANPESIDFWKLVSFLQKIMDMTDIKRYAKLIWGLFLMIVMIFDVPT